MVNTQNEIIEVRHIIENIYRYVHQHKEYINRLNVFPVPDGDTGLNITLTIQGALASIKEMNEAPITAGELLKEFSDNMLLNSRGCSGVILSLYIQGIAQILGNNDFSKENVYKALKKGYENAYKGTDKPQEGTILTIMDELHKKYAELINDEEDPVIIINKCLPHLREVLKKTPEMLPVLKKAGVVDSGGAGFLIILEGVKREFTFKFSDYNGVSLSFVLNVTKTIRKLLQSGSSTIKYSSLGNLLLKVGTEKVHNIRLRNIINDIQYHANNILNKNKKKLIKEAILKDLEEMESSWNPEIKLRYCTEFVLKSDRVSSKDEMKQIVEGYGGSIIVLKSNNLYKVHIHTNKPDSVFKEVSKFGDIVFTKVDDMKKQHRNFISEDTIEYEREQSIFCIVSGEGFKEILLGLGADDVMCYSRKKPSVDQLVKAINRMKAKNIIAAPDDKDILMSLKYAASLSKSNVHVIESKSVISLISILMGASNDIDYNNMSFIKRLNDIRYCSISRAIRESITENSIRINKNDFFTIYKGNIILAGKDLKEVITKSIQKLVQEESLVTFYAGIPAKKYSHLFSELKELFTNLDFEEYYGGQYQYYYHLTFE